ncbi:MAG TPA: DUF1287 domain-containing protein [Anaeromyxobacter sp.]|nr:DUF1287 domain-containing protein [Anaeromyxobacter sp.]
MPSREAVTALIAALALALAGRSAAQATGSEERVALARRLVDAAVARAQVKVRYDPSYVRLPYPGGDVPAGTGVCTDEIIRIYRAVGVDLQREVHQDVVASPAAYPRVRGRPDASIDHRRVPNLMAFLSRHGEVLPITDEPSDYRPGDLVVWDLQAGHIGMVVDRADPSGVRHLILHNVGAGPRIEDALFSWRIIGHYRYLPAASAPPRQAPGPPGRACPAAWPPASGSPPSGRPRGAGLRPASSRAPRRARPPPILFRRRRAVGRSGPGPPP